MARRNTCRYEIGPYHVWASNRKAAMRKLRKHLKIDQCK